MNAVTLVMSYLTRRASALAAALTLACLAMIQAQPAAAQDYSIRAGDTLRIEVLEDPSLNRTVLVAPDGRISVPSAGTLRAAGQTVESVQGNLTQRLAGNFATTPNVFVAIEQLAERRERVSRAPAAPRMISVYVMGEANKPGKLDVKPGTTVLQMFAVMGGFTKFAATKRVQLRRNEQVLQLNYNDIERGAASGRNRLQDGDVIVVPQRRLFE